jgi:hypothetical protein
MSELCPKKDVNPSTHFTTILFILEVLVAIWSNLLSHESNYKSSCSIPSLQTHSYLIEF